MKYYIDEKEVKEEEFNDKVWSQCLVHAYLNVDNGILQKDQKQIYENLAPLEQTLALNLIAKKAVDAYKTKTEFDINGFRFKKLN